MKHHLLNNEHPTLGESASIRKISTKLVNPIAVALFENTMLFGSIDII